MLESRGLTANDVCLLCEGPAHLRMSATTLLQGVVCNRCGRYHIEEGALRGFEDQRHLLSGITRRRSAETAAGDIVTVTRENVEELVATARLSGGMLDQLDASLEYAQEHQTRRDEFVEYREAAASDYPLVFARDGHELLHFLLTLRGQGFLDEPPERDPARRTAFRITPEGWQRIRELAKTGRDPDRAFVAMWFDPEMEPAWTDGIRPALESLGYTAVRIDRTHADDKVDDRIVAEIRRSGILVADFTNHRGGVYFEAGLALGLGIPIVWTCRRDDFDGRTHFDTRQYQHLLWETPEELREQLVNHIAARIPARPLP